MIRFRPTRRQIFAAVSPVAGLIVLLITMSWLLGRVHDMRQSTVLQVEVIKPTPPPVIAKPSAKPKKKIVKKKKMVKKKVVKKKPKSIKRVQAKPKNPTKPTIRGRVAMGRSLPAITVYSDGDINEYMKALYDRGCIFLVKSAMGKLFATYDPSTGEIAKEIPGDFRPYSPRSRILALYGENPKADRIIETAVQASSLAMFPDECKIVALLSLKWEDTLLDAIASAADSLGIDPQNIDSADASFTKGRFILNHISLRGGGVISVNRIIQS
jgi:hypothetical protein